jgi:hypothetical protein
MKSTALFVAVIALTSSGLRAAETNAKDEITNAAKALGAKDNYSWRSTVVVPEDAPFKPGPTEGKTEKDGYTWVSLSFGDNETKAVLKGEKAAATTPDGDWQSLAELDKAEGPTRFLGMMLRNFRTPAVQAVDLAAGAKELKKEGDVVSGDLTEEGAKGFLTFRRGGGSVTNPKGSVKFWLKDGALAKFEFHVKGTVDFNGNEFEQDRTTTVVIKDVGATKIAVPDEAKKKLS